MTKRRDLIHTIAVAARVKGISWDFKREGGNHSVWALDGLAIMIPRHNEIGARLTEAIYKQAEAKLGEGWWRK